METGRKKVDLSKVTGQLIKMGTPERWLVSTHLIPAMFVDAGNGALFIFGPPKTLISRVY